MIWLHEAIFHLLDDVFLFAYSLNRIHGNMGGRIHGWTLLVLVVMDAQRMDARLIGARLHIKGSLKHIKHIWFASHYEKKLKERDDTSNSSESLNHLFCGSQGLNQYQLSSFDVTVVNASEASSLGISPGS